MLKRIFDVIASALGILFLAPLLLLIAVVVKAQDSGPIIFRQIRMGKGGRPFRLLKFRTMFVGAEEKGLGITMDGDCRVTSLGRVLRKTKLDELPQLWNVLAGEMSLVGPRPELPKYVKLYTAEQRRVLEMRPGITDFATLEYRNEEELLARAGDPEMFYMRSCLPAKISLNLRYASSANLWSDIQLIFRTLFFCWVKRS